MVPPLNRLNEHNMFENYITYRNYIQKILTIFIAV